MLLKDEKAFSSLEAIPEKSDHTIPPSLQVIGKIGEGKKWTQSYDGNSYL